MIWFLEYVGFDKSSDIYEAAYKKGEGGLSLNKRPKMTSLWSWSLTTEVNRAETSFTQLQVFFKPPLLLIKVNLSKCLRAREHCHPVHSCEAAGFLKLSKEKE